MNIIITNPNTEYATLESKQKHNPELEHIPVEEYEILFDEWEASQPRRRREQALDLAASQVADWGYKSDEIILKRMQRRQPLVRMWVVIHTMPHDLFTYLWVGDDKPTDNQAFEAILGRQPKDDESDGQLIVRGPFQWPDYYDGNLLAEIDVDWEGE